MPKLSMASHTAVTSPGGLLLRTCAKSWASFSCSPTQGSDAATGSEPRPPKALHARAAARSKLPAAAAVSSSSRSAATTAPASARRQAAARAAAEATWLPGAANVRYTSASRVSPHSPRVSHSDSSPPEASRPTGQPCTCTASRNVHASSKSASRESDHNIISTWRTSAGDERPSFSSATAAFPTCKIARTEPDTSAIGISS
mmetsp:Transcript_6268/g.23586  ORF Transcript_6268/g.23586 Transcript_6268/m.23586 type:complete len:202 (-) Transcript_6268:282-887(-)